MSVLENAISPGRYENVLFFIDALAFGLLRTSQKANILNPRRAIRIIDHTDAVVCHI